MVPKKRQSTYRKGRRRSAISLSLPDLVICSHCKEKLYPNMVCPNCGHFKGTEIINITNSKGNILKPVPNENQKRSTA